MKIFVTLFVFILSGSIAIAQNVGIGILNPTRAKLEVSGAVGNTTVIFTDSSKTSSLISGFSLQRSPAAIGFNTYYTNQNYYIGNGPAMLQWLNPSNGSMYFDFIENIGTQGAAATGLARGLTIQQNGNTSLYTGEQNATLFVGLPNKSKIFRGTQYHTEFNKFMNIIGHYYTYINGGKNGSDVYINDDGTKNIYLGSGNADVIINGAPGSYALRIKQQGGHGVVLVEPSTFHHWEFVTTKNLTEPNSDYYVYYNGSYRGNFFHIDGSYYPVSDKRLKKDFQPLTGVLEKVMLLQPVSYKMKSDNAGQRRDLGFIAQDMAAVIPELTEIITEDKTKTGYQEISNLYSMHYDGMAPILVKAIQQQQKKIKQLQATNETVRKRIEEIEKLLE